MSGTYSYWLVLLSVLVATLASYTALDLASRITAAKGRAALLWLVGGAFSMGTGIWSMHFIGMLAFSLPVPMGYDAPVTLLSMLIAIVASGFALYTVSRDTLAVRNLLWGGVLMGIGIASMHYTGMAAMQTSPPIQYDPLLFCASIVIAISASLAALWIAFTLRTESVWMIYAKYAAAVIMGAAITGMHYTGMAAARFAADTICLTGPLVDNSWMAGTIALVTFLILSTTRVLSVLDARMATHTARMAKSLQKANAELKHMVLHDPLTHLPNRLLLEDRIGQAIGGCQRAGTRCAALFVDLDRFKSVNDSLGHFVGDELLRAVAERLQNGLRREDTLGRLGGDDFVLLQPVKNVDEAGVLAQRILAALARPFEVEGETLGVAASIGISVYPSDGRDFAELLKNADAAMYHAKESGRGTFRFFSPALNARAMERLRLENELRGALGRGELLLHWHPVLKGQGLIAGAEALVRWNHPERGLLQPEEFVPLAEECGLIRAVGEWTLERAVSQAGAWSRKLPGRPWVAVNVSAQELAQGDAYYEKVRTCLRDNMLDGDRLELEVTERVLMSNLAENLDTLRQIGSLGVRFAIDDFGTGYSSLAYLRILPVHKIKIDRSFLREIETHPADEAIVRAIAAMASTLGIEIAAEGVENEAQLKRLLALGCEQWQGHHFSQPVEAPAFEKLALSQTRSARRI